MIPSLPRVDYLAIGHITHDVLPEGGYAVGGTAAYAAFTASALGRTVGVCTGAGPDFEPSLFANIASLSCAPSPVTTTFENIYVNGHREQFVYAIALPLTLNHVPDVWLNAPVVHIGPIMGECDITLLEHFARSAFVGVTPQGWLRAGDEHGKVFPKSWSDAEKYLSLASAIVLSVDDVGGDWDLLQTYAQHTHILVVTRGWQGGTVFVDGKATTFPAVPVTEVDPTGAGDIFATTFFIALARGTAPMAAANQAACLAARSVTREGLSSTPGPADVAVCLLK
jgi:sugar/nucleoside kinase (ribokinase family)